MKPTRSVLAAASVLLLVIGPVRSADDKTGTNQAPPATAAKAKISAEAGAVQQLHLAHSLIQYGRQNKAPEALITAARILATYGTVELKEKPSHETAQDAPKGDPREKGASADSPKALLEEAKKLSNNNAAIVALANAVELPRGAIGGPRLTVETVRPLTTDVYKIAFRADEVARVAVSGDGDTRLDLYVYDENGNLIASQVGPGDDCLASWVPKWTGVFIIKVVNRGRLANRYTFVAN